LNLTDAGAELSSNLAGLMYGLTELYEIHPFVQRY